MQLSLLFIAILLTIGIEQQFIANSEALISLHNGRILSRFGTARNATVSPLRQRSAGFMMRPPRRRDASVFRLKFLDGTDADAFEFVSPGSGWGVGDDSGYLDRSPTAGPLDYDPDAVDDYDAEQVEDDNQRLTDTTSSSTENTERSTSTTPMRTSSNFNAVSDDDQLLVVDATSHDILSTIVTDQTTTSPLYTESEYAYQTAETEVANAGWPSLETDSPEIEEPYASSISEEIIETLSSTSSPTPSFSTSTSRSTKPTYQVILCNGTNPVTSLPTTTEEITTAKSIDLTTTTQNPCLVAANSTTERLNETFWITFEVTSGTISPGIKEDLASTLENVTATPFINVTQNYETEMPDNQTMIETFSPVSNNTAFTINVNVTEATTLIYDGSNSAEIVDAMHTSTPMPKFESTMESSTLAIVDRENSTFPTTADVSNSSGSMTTFSEPSNLISTEMMENVTLPFISLSTSSSQSFSETSDDETSIETTIDVTTTISSSTTSKPEFNISVIPFGNLNVAKVRMSIHVTTAFRRKQLERLLQQGIQNAFISSLNRNARGSDETLTELRRIIRMTNPMIEVIAVAVPPRIDPKATVTHLNVTFGAVLNPNHLKSDHHLNHTIKSHLSKHTLPGRHVRDIMLAVSPIELSAAAGIPIESIRPVNEGDYDIIIESWNRNVTGEDDNGETYSEQPEPEPVPTHKMPDWVLPVVIVAAVIVLLLVYVVVTGVCVLKGYRLRLEKVGSISATSPDGRNSYADGAARLAEVVSLPNQTNLASSTGTTSTTFPVQPLAPGVPQMFLPPESGSPKAPTKPQLELRRWTIDGQDERLITRIQQHGLALDPISAANCSEPSKPIPQTKTIVPLLQQDVTCDKSMNTSSVMLQNMGTVTEGPEVVNRATSAVHRQNRTTGTSSTQFQTDQSTDTTIDIGQRMKSIQTLDNMTTPDSACSVGVTINGERVTRNSITKLPTPFKDRQRRRSRRRARDRSGEKFDTADGSEQCRVQISARHNHSNGMASNSEQTSGILLNPLELRYDTIYLRQSDKPDSKQIDAPFKLIKLTPGIDSKEHLVQNIHPISLEEAKKIDDEVKETRRRGGQKHGKEKSQTEQKEGDQIKNILDKVEGIMRQYTTRMDSEPTKLDASESIQRTMQRDITYIKPRTKVGRNMRAVSPDEETKPQPVLASFEAALRLRVADETIGEERVRKQYQIPLVQNAAGSASMIARHLLERGKIGCLPDT